VGCEPGFVCATRRNAHSGSWPGQANYSSGRLAIPLAARLRCRLADLSSGVSSGAQRVTSHPILGDLPPASPVVFTFDGETVTGREGEPLLPALLASGVRVLRTMPDLGDPRGGYCLIGRCSDCQVLVDGVPSVRACMTPVREGMVVRVQHGLGIEAWDVAGDEL
jgi:hypothetical protein